MTLTLPDDINVSFSNAIGRGEIRKWRVTVRNAGGRIPRSFETWLFSKNDIPRTQLLEKYLSGVCHAIAETTRLGFREWCAKYGKDEQARENVRQYQDMLGIRDDWERLLDKRYDAFRAEALDMTQGGLA